MPTWQVLTRRGCHLCEDFYEALLPIVRQRAIVELVDIDQHAELAAEWGERIPVLREGEQVICEGRVDPRAVLIQLSMRL